jgi:hypothetical protein
LVLRIPIERRVELDITPPAGWRLTSRPPRRLDAEWGSVAETLTPADGGRRSILHVTLPAQIVAPQDYQAFARFCQAVDELATRPPRLERSSP